MFFQILSFLSIIFIIFLLIKLSNNKRIINEELIDKYNDLLISINSELSSHIDISNIGNEKLEKYDKKVNKMRNNIEKIRLENELSMKNDKLTLFNINFQKVNDKLDKLKSQ